ncbi:sulfotransferase domain-containing protein [Pseudoalteromonas sp. C2R02]|uniref:sulfotransferase domain-containing protein n=1 Tax=Pseudoalteromonas sp. C2R02 TaxID=2841565 RepID=UPI001C091245|nr:sulfotransferase domain-containing protein [Pseudoalteromonas sp. C2R02]MBU2971731.1 sulfotransferase domain-containing protein [Pseudoalteromonas sp. C2R02]
MALNNHAIMLGMSRAGTTYMYHIFSQHPESFVPIKKEIGFYSHHYQNGLQWYEGFFKQAKHKEKTIDICGVYFSVDASLDRLINTDKNTKFILCLRDPYEWIFSLYEHYDKQFKIPRFSNFLDGCVINRENTSFQLNFNNNQISEKIRKYQAEFGDRLFIYDFNYFQSNPLAVVQALEKFLNLKPHFNSENIITEKVNVRGASNLSMLYKMLNKSGLSKLITTILPKPLVVETRRFIERRATKKIKKIQKEYTDIEHNKVKDMFNADHQFYNEIFKNSPIIDGNGRAFKQ